MSARPRGTDSAKVIQVIETRSLRGLGTEKDPARAVIQYWDLEGNFLAESDSEHCIPCLEHDAKVTREYIQERKL